ncbi:hypothetical protein OIE52_38950 [Streptomyces canus]|uniref:hypothetical protein n=1 Tax=Streptomyces canus TaxID=58343 RepID=UPI00325131E8
MNEIAQPSTAEEARARAERIRSGMRVLAEWQQDVIAAYAKDDWRTLGYASWDAYLDGEFGEHRVKLPREQRREIVASMSAAGMSTRAIGAAVGVDHKTVVNDRAATGEFSPVPETVLSLDGRERPATRPAVANVWNETSSPIANRKSPLTNGQPRLEGHSEEVIDAEIVDDPAPRSYSSPAAPERAPDRQPRVDASRTILVALTELRQTRESLEALTVAQLARQDEETRRIWAARLNTELEALTDFHNTLIKENNQ